MLRRCLSLVLTTSLVLGLAACGEASFSKPSLPNAGEGVSWRKPVEVENKVRFVDTDGDFEYKMVDWVSPEGYTIIIPSGDTQAKSLQILLRNSLVLHIL